MLDAKLVAVMGVMGVLVAVGMQYVGSGTDSVQYTDPFAEKFNYMCSAFDGGGCASEVCNQLKAGTITVDTPLAVTCDGYTTTGSLKAMGEGDDWRTRATLVNSEEPLEATAEWCAKNGAADGGVSITDSTSEDMGECGKIHPIIAASVDAEYDRFVARSHVETFAGAIDLFCADTDDADLQDGCEELRAGFKGWDSEFKVACGDGKVATYVLSDIVQSLDAIKADAGGEAEVQAYFLAQCVDNGRRMEDVKHIDYFHEPALNTARRLAGVKGEEADNEMNAMATPEGRNLSTESLSDKLARLRDEHSAPEEHVMVETNDKATERQLWGHRHSPHWHWPHSHNPHEHVPADCGRCRNKCGNTCYGRCGPGCTKWAACGCGGNDAHNACSHHDHACSCGAMWYPSCLALGVTAIAPNWGVSWAPGCSAGNTFFNHAVMGWGHHFKGWPKENACQWDQMN